VVFARRLANHLAADQPLYGIQAQGLDGRREPLETIEAMAERYYALMREVQPNGPYYLGGHSLGGLICLELAQRIIASGERVGMLALFDTPGPGYPRRLALPLRVADHLFVRAARLFKRNFTGAAELPDPEEEVVAYRTYNPLKTEAGGESGELVDAITHVTEVNTEAGRRYVRRFYDGHVHFFRATQTPRWPGMRFDDARCGFGSLVASMEIVPIDSTHRFMMDEPFVSELGRELQIRLRECQQRFGGTRGSRPGHARLPSHVAEQKAPREADRPRAAR
jgi:aspartate racemase